MASALGGARPAELSLEYQLRHTPRYPELAAAADAAGQKPAFAGLLDTFNCAGFTRLQNGLGEPENQRLMRSDDVDEVVGLVVQGLRRISER